ncbi:MAG: MoxR family ATPase [Chitinophagaceae bacterium]|nr:MoxR family ATPase [Chitinophagaceae bacterium]MCW5927375.1 MoxR family ATPase [Chitinophagaceae bacterium]
MEENLFQNRVDLSALNEAVMKMRTEISKVIVGQDDMVKLIITALLSDGHVLIEGVPGVAKTLTARLVARCIDLQFSRVQFTPDLMPSDVLGTSVFNPREGAFQFKRGPIFGNIVLVDEINRAPAKTQAALFEVMEEKQVTVDGQSHLMQRPFMVLATQNPVEQEGTYRLPEAQLDRFLFKILVPYPTEEQEVAILNRFHQATGEEVTASLESVLTATQIDELRRLVRQVIVEEKLLQFIAQIVTATRNNKSIYLGASPRASLAIMISAKALAAIHGRDFVTPEDIIEMATPVLRHRIILTPEKEMEGGTEDAVIKEIIHSLEIPR